MRHTGAMISLEKGAAVRYSVKHKLNTKISTESDIISAYDMLIKVLWSVHFIQVQGYLVDQNMM